MSDSLLQPFLGLFLVAPFKTVLVVIYFAAFLGAKDLTAAVRPEHFAAVGAIEIDA